MQLDRNTYMKLSMGGGGYQREYTDAISEEQIDLQKAREIMTCQSPISEKHTESVARILQMQKDGEITMEQAARIINGIDSKPEDILSKNSRFKIRSRK